MIKNDNKKQKIMLIVNILIIIFMLISCSVEKSNQITNNQKKEKRFRMVSLFSEEFPNIPNGLLAFYERPSNSVKMIAKFPKEIKTVKYGSFDGQLTESKITPQGCYWVDFTDKCGKLFVVGYPKDGTKEISYSFVVNASGAYTLKYDPHNFEEQEIIFKYGHIYTDLSREYRKKNTFFKCGLDTIPKAFIEYNGRRMPMEVSNNHVLKTKNSTIFVYKTALPSSPCAKIYVYDQDEDLLDMLELKMAFEEKRKYFCLSRDIKGERSICSTNIHGGDFKLEYFIDVPLPKLQEDKEYPDYKFISNGSNDVNLLSVSLGARYFFLRSNWRRNSESLKANIFVNSLRVQNTEITDYLIFDSLKRTYHSIDIYYTYLFDRPPWSYNKGSVILPIKWYENRVVCSLVTKENNDVDNKDMTIKTSLSEKLIAKGIEINLSTFEINNTEEFKLSKPNICFSDDSTDLIGYNGIADSIVLLNDSPFNSGEYFNGDTITDYKITKKYNIDDLFYKVFPKGFKSAGLRFCGSRIMNGRKTLFYFFRGDNIPPSTINMEREQDPPGIMPGFIEKMILFSLDFDTGKITKIVDIKKKTEEKWPQNTPTHFHICLGSGNELTNIWASLIIKYSNNNSDSLYEEHDPNFYILADGILTQNKEGFKPIIGGIIR